MITRLAWATGATEGVSGGRDQRPERANDRARGSGFTLSLSDRRVIRCPWVCREQTATGDQPVAQPKRSNRCPLGGSGTDAMRRSGSAKPPWGRTTEGGTAAAAQVRAAAINQREATVTGDGWGRMWRTKAILLFCYHAIGGLPYFVNTSFTASINKS
jgi:hypothetical protein